MLVSTETEREREKGGRTGRDEETGDSRVETARQAKNTDDKRNRRSDSIASLLKPAVETLLVQLRSVVLIRLLLVSFRERLFASKRSNRSDAACSVAESREEGRARGGDLFASGEGGADVEVCDEEEDEEDEGSGDEEDREDDGDGDWRRSERE
jgi:hypothetical protein